MAKVKFLANIYGLGKKGETKEIPDSEVSRLGNDIEVLEAPKKKEPKNRKVSKKSVKTK